MTEYQSEPNPYDRQPLDITDDELVAMTKYLVRLFIVDTDTDPFGDGTSFPNIPIAEFLEWVHLYDKIEDAREILTTSMNIRDEAVSSFHRALNTSPFTALKILMPLWPLCIMQMRPVSRHPISMSHIALSFVYGDKKVLQLQANSVHAPGQVSNDGYIVTIMQHQCTRLLNTIAMNGFEKLYQDYAMFPVQTEVEATPPKQIEHAPAGIMGL